MEIKNDCLRQWLLNWWASLEEEQGINSGGILMMLENAAPVLYRSLLQRW